MSAEQEEKPPGMNLALIFLLNNPELVYSPSTFQLLHGTLYCFPSPKSCALIPWVARSLCLSGIWITTTLSKQKAERFRRNLPKLVPLLCRSCPPPQHNPVLDWGLSSFQLQILWAELNWLHFSTGNKDTAEWDAVLQEVCHVWHQTNTKFNKSTSGPRGWPSCCIGWDCQLRSFWIQKQVCVPANKRGMGFLGVKANLPRTQGNVLFLETTSKRV